MKKLLVAMVILLVSSAYADTFNTNNPDGTAPISFGINFVKVGDVGNSDSNNYYYLSRWTQIPGLGGVAYNYRISETETTVGQMNAMYHMLGDTVDLSSTMPASSRWTRDMFMYVNWLNAGCPVDSGSSMTHGGVYNMTWDTSSSTWIAPWPEAEQWDNGDGTKNIWRHKDAKYFLPTEDEWIKAATYKGGSTNAGYWLFPTSTDASPTAEGPSAGTNSANFAGQPGSVNIALPVGSYPNSQSPYGALDMAGNVWEICEVAGDGTGTISAPGWGGSFNQVGTWLRGTINFAYSSSWSDLGFRVASAYPWPVFTPDLDAVYGPTAITITCLDPSADIYYTTDGTTPTTASDSYSGPVTVTGGTTLKAIAVVDGVTSMVVSQTYVGLTIVESRSGTITTTTGAGTVTTPTGGTLDLLMHNGSLHVDGMTYSKIILRGQVTNWSSHVDASGEEWREAWSFISLLGSDYFTGRNVPAIADESMAIYSYASVDGSDNDYGVPAQQRGFGQNAGLLFWGDGLLDPQGQIDSAFATQDCDFASASAAGADPDDHKGDFHWNKLSDDSQFEYEIAYDFSAGTLTTKIRDVGDAAWDAEQTKMLGLRDAIGTDDSSDLVMSVQMANNLESGTESYGFDYTIDMAIANILPGDANLDGSVDVGDLGILAANYGQSDKTWAKGDFNGDGAVDVGDLGILAANYGTSSSSANWDADYAKVFGETAEEDNNTDDSSICSGLGLPLIAGFVLMGLMLIKLEE